MPALDFQPRFRRLILLGEKRQTIRKVRKRPIRVGDALFLYGGQRRKGGGNRLMEATCVEASPICIRSFRPSIPRRVPSKNRPRIRPRLVVGVCLDGEHLSRADIIALARRDGFPGPFGFIRFFVRTHGLPFQGVLIRW